MTLREINLIPDDILLKKDLSRHLVIWGVVLFVSLFFILGFFIYQKSSVSGLKVAPGLLADIDAKLLSRTDEVRVLQRKISSLKQQENSHKNKRSDLFNTTRKIPVQICATEIL